MMIGSNDGWHRAMAMMLAFLCGSQLVPKTVAQELNQQTYQSICRELSSGVVPPWRTIPWQISLLQAQRMAATEGKPIFIWAMDGHPLGCT